MLIKRAPDVKTSEITDKELYCAGMDMRKFYIRTALGCGI